MVSSSLPRPCLRLSFGQAQDTTWVRPLQEEAGTIFKTLERLEPTIWRLGHAKASAKRDKDEFPHGFLQQPSLPEPREQCVMALIQAARDIGIVKSDAVLMFDGIMVLREDVHASYAQQNAPTNLSGVLQCLETVIQKRTGYKVQLNCKSMDQGLDLPHDWEKQIMSPEDAAKTIITGGEREASKVFLTMVSDEVKRCDGVVYARIGGIWTCEKDRVKDCLVVKALDANMCTLDSSGTLLFWCVG